MRRGNMNVLNDCVPKNWMSLTISCTRASSVHLRSCVLLNKYCSTSCQVTFCGADAPAHVIPSRRPLIANNLFSICKSLQLKLFYEFIAVRRLRFNFDKNAAFVDRIIKVYHVLESTLLNWMSYSGDWWLCYSII